MEVHELHEKVASIREKTKATLKIVARMKSDEFVKAANGNGKRPPPKEESDEQKEQRP